MKIYVLLMLISVIVGFSYFPGRKQSTPPTPLPSDSVPA